MLAAGTDLKIVQEVLDHATRASQPTPRPHTRTLGAHLGHTNHLTPPT